MISEAEYWKISDEMHALTEEEYDALERCPNCHENNPRYLEIWPRTHPRQTVGNFWQRKCLSCGRYFSLWTNYLKARKITV